ncbi:MAG: hypothetical protein BGP01_00020 [Paludibacter sp. 47-17]|nr:MAG: hypothetical protein BGP01_00020 [Paludibacter sp. 47-17]
MQRKTSSGAGLYYIHTDLLGSIERVTNATGQLVNEYTYTPWGGRVLLSGVNITDHGYTGHEHLTPFRDDSNSGFCLSGGAGSWAVVAIKTAGIITGAAVGAASGAVMGGASSFLLNGGNNLLNGNGFLANWQQSVKSGLLTGAITGGIAGGISGYSEALQQGKNMWWGTEIKHGRNQWSFFTSEKPYDVVDFKLMSGDNPDLKMDCGPATIKEVDNYFGGKRSFNEIAKKIGYQEHIGTDALNVKNELFNTYGGEQVYGADVMNIEYVKEVAKSKHLITIYSENMDKGIPHFDNIRKISYYSNKTIIKLRIGSYTLNDNLIFKHGIIFFRIIGK